MTPYLATMVPDGQTFVVKENEIILDAAIRQGVTIAYSCQYGTCRTCMVQVHEGDVLQEGFCMMTPQELQDNYRLLCMSTLKSDCTLEKRGRRVQVL